MTNDLATLPAPSAIGRRLASVDALRGYAIALMILDHLLVVTGYATSPLRFTLTRAALPIFMIVAGALVSRVNARRLIWVAIWGLMLPAMVPWIDDPNILVEYALGVLVLVMVRNVAGARGDWIVLAVCLTLLANGYGNAPGGYPPPAVIAMMAAGALGRDVVFALRVRAPRPLRWLGRHPLGVYVVHLLILNAARGLL